MILSCGQPRAQALSKLNSEFSAVELSKVLFWLMAVGYTLKSIEVCVSVHGCTRVSACSGTLRWATHARELRLACASGACMSSCVCVRLWSSGQVARSAFKTTQLARAGRVVECGWSRAAL